MLQFAKEMSLLNVKEE